MSFLLVVSWMHHCYDDVDDPYYESIRLYEDVPTQTTMFLTGQDAHGEIDAAEPDKNNTHHHQLRARAERTHQ